MQRVLYLLVAWTFLSLAPACAQQATVSTQVVYLFGVSQNLADTTVYMSEVLELPAAQLDKKGFLQARGKYSEQFRQYVEQSTGTARQTTAVTFATTREKAEKALVKTFKKLNEQKFAGRTLRVTMVPRSDFQFKPLIAKP